MDTVTIIVEPKPGAAVEELRFPVAANDAPRVAAGLASLTGHRVRTEQVYGPAVSAPTTAPARTSVEKGASVEGSAPDLILKRINSDPARIFSRDDFMDMGFDVRRVETALYRLSTVQKKIARVARGRFRALQGGPMSTAARLVDAAPKVRPGGADEKVLMFMRDHPDKSMSRSEVTAGMKLAPDRANAIGASLRRLAVAGKLDKGKRKFRFREVQQP